MELKDWSVLIFPLLGVILGGNIVMRGNKQMFKLEREQRNEEIALNRNEKVREKILDERTEAYKELYTMVVGSWGIDAKELSKQSREWSKNYDLFSTKEITTLILKFWFAHKAYDDNQNPRTKDAFGQSILNIREEIRKQIGIELADPEYMTKLWDLEDSARKEES